MNIDTFRNYFAIAYMYVRDAWILKFSSPHQCMDSGQRSSFVSASATICNFGSTVSQRLQMTSLETRVMH